MLADSSHVDSFTQKRDDSNSNTWTCGPFELPQLWDAFGTSSRLCSVVKGRHPRRASQGRPPRLCIAQPWKRPIAESLVTWNCQASPGQNQCSMGIPVSNTVLADTSHHFEHSSSNRDAHRTTCLCCCIWKPRKPCTAVNTVNPIPGRHPPLRVQS